MIVGFSIAGAGRGDGNTPFAAAPAGDFLPNSAQVDSWIAINPTTR